MVNISIRMKRLCDYVKAGARVCDVGCDHGFVSIYLVENNIAGSALAMDVRTGPLSRAREHIADAALEDKIETRLSDGLKNYTKGACNTLIIAGMGGKLMARILSEGREFWEDFEEVILEPQSDIPWFRHFLLDNGFEIKAEDLIFEEGKYYFFINCSIRGDGKEESDYLSECPKNSEAAFYLGSYNIKQAKPVLKDYLGSNLRILENVMQKVVSSPETEARNEKLRALENEKQLILEGLEGL